MRAAVERTGAVALRIGVDGPVPGDRAVFADALAGAAADLGAPVARVSAEDFQRPRSVRLEHGGADPEAGYERWYDEAGLAREVLDPLGPGGSGRWLPALWDAARDRATRAPAEQASPGAVLVLDGPFLLRWELSGALDVVVHLTTSPAAQRRRLAAGPGAAVPADDPAAADRVPGAWAIYLETTDPAARADVLVRCEDPHHPALELPAG